MSNKYIDMFLDVMVAERGASPRTISAYERDLTDVDAYLAVRGIDLRKATRRQLEEYMHTIVKNALSPKTQSRRLSAIREFYRFLFSENLVKKNPADYLESPKVGKSLPKYLTEAEVIALLDAAEKKDMRLKTLLEVLYASGMRVSELVCLPVLAVTRDNKTITVMGKGNKERLVPLNDKASEALNQWLIVPLPRCQRRTLDTRWLF